MGVDESGVVRFTVKELIADTNGRIATLDEKLDRLLDRLDAKADHEMVVALEARVDVLEKTEAERRGFTKAQKAIVGLLGAIAALLVPIVIAVAQQL